VSPENKRATRRPHLDSRVIGSEAASGSGSPASGCGRTRWRRPPGPRRSVESGRISASASSMAERGFVRRPPRRRRRPRRDDDHDAADECPARVPKILPPPHPRGSCRCWPRRSWTRIRSELGFLENPRDAGRRGALPASPSRDRYCREKCLSWVTGDGTSRGLGRCSALSLPVQRRRRIGERRRSLVSAEPKRSQADVSAANLAVTKAALPPTAVCLDLSSLRRA